MYELSVFIILITGLTEALRRAFKIKENYLPLLSVILGLILAFIGKNGIEGGISEILFMGLIFGLSACGLFKGIESGIYATKRIVRKVKSKESV